MKPTHFGIVDKSEHGPTKARAQRLFDDADLLTAECLLIGNLNNSSLRAITHGSSVTKGAFRLERI